MRVPGYLKVHTPAKASAAHAGVRKKGGDEAEVTLSAQQHNARGWDNVNARSFF